MCTYSDVCEKVSWYVRVCVLEYRLALFFFFIYLFMSNYVSRLFGEYFQTRWLSVYQLSQKECLRRRKLPIQMSPSNLDASPRGGLLVLLIVRFSFPSFWSLEIRQCYILSVFFFFLAIFLDWIKFIGSYFFLFFYSKNMCKHL